MTAGAAIIAAGATGAATAGAIGTTTRATAPTGTATAMTDAIAVIGIPTATSAIPVTAIGGMYGAAITLIAAMRTSSAASTGATIIGGAMTAGAIGPIAVGPSATSFPPGCGGSPCHGISTTVCPRRPMDAAMCMPTATSCSS